MRTLGGGGVEGKTSGWRPGKLIDPYCVHNERTTCLSFNLNGKGESRTANRIGESDWQKAAVC